MKFSSNIRKIFFFFKYFDTFLLRYRVNKTTIAYYLIPDISISRLKLFSDLFLLSRRNYQEI